MEPEVTREFFKRQAMGMSKKASFYYNLFTSPHGEKVLDDLEKECNGSYLTGNSMMDCNMDINPNEFMMLREGQTSVLRYINRMINFYSNKENR